MSPWLKPEACLYSLSTELHVVYSRTVCVVRRMSQTARHRCPPADTERHSRCAGHAQGSLNLRLHSKLLCPGLVSRWAALQRAKRHPEATKPPTGRSVFPRTLLKTCRAGSAGRAGGRPSEMPRLPAQPKGLQCGARARAVLLPQARTLLSSRSRCPADRLTVTHLRQPGRRRRRGTPAMSLSPCQTTRRTGCRQRRRRPAPSPPAWSSNAGARERVRHAAQAGLCPLRAGTDSPAASRSHRRLASPEGWQSLCVHSMARVAGLRYPTVNQAVSASGRMTQPPGLQRDPRERLATRTWRSACRSRLASASGPLRGSQTSPPPQRALRAQTRCRRHARMCSASVLLCCLETHELHALSPNAISKQQHVGADRFTSCTCFPDANRTSPTPEASCFVQGADHVWELRGERDDLRKCT